MTSRRSFLYGMMATPIALRAKLDAALLAVGNNPAWTENQKQGTPAWQIGLPPYVNSNDTDLWIRGYASAPSINKGEKITFNITTNAYNWKAAGPVPYIIDVYRVGWYSGDGGRLMKHVGPFNGVQQPGGTQNNGVTSPPPIDPDTGLIELSWTGDGLGNGSYQLDTSIPPDGSNTNDWTSGIYLALLTTRQVQYSSGDPDHQSYIIFTIRDDARSSDILFQQAVATYQAYNNYPDDRTNGKSLYDSGSYGVTTTLGTQRAVKVSFDRPYTYTDHTGAGDFLHWELYFVRWLERNGYDVAYSTDVDTHVNPATVLNHKTFLSVGHAEYWSREMRDAVEGARDQGTSIGIFGANAVYNQIRFEPSPVTGTTNRVIVCYKDPALDPVNDVSKPVYNPPLTTVPFRSSPVNRPEQTLIGVMYDDYFSAEAPALPYVVQNSTHWMYAGTGFTNGGKVPGVLGYELDRQLAAYPLPNARLGTYSLLGNSPYTGVNGAGISHSSIYQAVNGPGAWVLGAGTIDWSFGLDSYVPPQGINTRGVPALSNGLQQATANFLNITTGRLRNPTNLVASVPGGKFKINLSWVNNSLTQTGVLIERSLDGVRFVQLAVVALTVTSYADTTANNTTIYYYRVAAFDALSISAYSNTAAQGPPPVAPSGLMAIPVSPGSIDLTWLDNATNELSYLVEISTDNSKFTQIAQLPPNSVSYTGTGLTSGRKYYFRVRAQNSFGNSPYSATAAAVPLGPPLAPTKLTANPASGTQINLAWQDASSTETGFQILRSPDGVTFTPIATVGAGVTTYANTGLTKATRYSYQVKAYNTYGSSAGSNIATATTKNR